MISLARRKGYIAKLTWRSDWNETSAAQAARL